MKIKKKNNVQWVRICSKKIGRNSGAAKKSEQARVGGDYIYKCGWINEIDQMILTSSVYSEIKKKVQTKKEKEAEEIAVPDTPVTNSYCTGSGYDANNNPWNIKCYCKRKVI